MTRKIPKLKEYRSEHKREATEEPIERVELPVVEPESLTGRSVVKSLVFPESANDAVLEKLVRERAFAALEAKLVSCYGSIPDEIKDEVEELRRSIA